MQVALAAANPGAQILVAEGTYNPDQSDRTVSFVIPDGVEVIGGYEGVLNGVSDPDTFPTVLSGEIGSATSVNDNIHHVVRTSTGANSPSTALRNVTVAGGNANQAFSGQFDIGGGILAEGALVIDNVQIINNRALRNGGGIYVGHPNVVITESTIIGNSALQGGGVELAAAATIQDSYVLDNRATSTSTRGWSLLDPAMNNSNAVVVPLDDEGRIDVNVNGGVANAGLPVTHIRGVVLGYYE